MKEVHRLCHTWVGNQCKYCGMVYAEGNEMSTSNVVGVAEQMPGASGFTMVVFKSSDVPVGTKLYTTPQPLEDTPVAWVDEKADVLKFGGWDAQPFAKSFKPVFYKVAK